MSAWIPWCVSTQHSRRVSPIEDPARGHHGACHPPGHSLPSCWTRIPSIYVNPTGRFVIGGPAGDTRPDRPQDHRGYLWRLRRPRRRRLLRQGPHQGGPQRRLYGPLRRPRTLWPPVWPRKCQIAAGLCHRRGPSGEPAGGYQGDRHRLRRAPGPGGGEAASSLRPNAIISRLDLRRPCPPADGRLRPLRPHGRGSALGKAGLRGRAQAGTVAPADWRTLAKHFAPLFFAGCAMHAREG